jgi:putative membrane protein
MGEMPVYKEKATIDILEINKTANRLKKNMSILIAIIINTLAVLVTGYILPGIHLRSFWTALAVAIVLGIVNAILRPIIFILTLPINILTLGLFSFVIIGLLVYLVSAIVPGFKVDNFGWAILFALIVALINWALWKLIPK